MCWHRWKGSLQWHITRGRRHISPNLKQRLLHRKVEIPTTTTILERGVFVLRNENGFKFMVWKCLEVFGGAQQFLLDVAKSDKVHCESYQWKLWLSRWKWKWFMAFYVLERKGIYTFSYLEDLKCPLPTFFGISSDFFSFDLNENPQDVPRINKNFWQDLAGNLFLSVIIDISSSGRKRLCILLVKNVLGRMDCDRNKSTRCLSLLLTTWWKKIS